MPFLSEDLRRKIEAYIPRYPSKQAVTLPALHLVHDEMRCVPREAIREIAAIAPPPLDDPSRASDGGTNPLASGYGATPGHQPVPSACVPTSMFHVKRSNAVHGADLSPGARYQYRRHVAMPGRRRWHSRAADPHTSDSDRPSPGV